MHLCAYSQEGKIIFAPDAKRQIDYQCLECNAPVRLREGLFRQPHFFHSNQRSLCRQNGKSLTHLNLQLYIQALLKGEASIEAPFRNIGRIADVVWEREKLIFEIQCSFISKEEVLSRNSDYASIGYQTVWILHDKRYNKSRISSCELGLNSAPHYFTNMTPHGQGMIYDQWQWIVRGLRKSVLPALPIDIEKPFRLAIEKTCGQKIRKLGFEGDFCSLKSDHFYVGQAKELEKNLLAKRNDLSFFISEIKKKFRFLLRALLKPYCRRQPL